MRVAEGRAGLIDVNYGAELVQSQGEPVVLLTCSEGVPDVGKAEVTVGRSNTGFDSHAGAGPVRLPTASVTDASMTTRATLWTLAMIAACPPPCERPPTTMSAQSVPPEASR